MQNAMHMYVAFIDIKVTSVEWHELEFATQWTCLAHHLIGMKPSPHPRQYEQGMGMVK